MLTATKHEARAVKVLRKVAGGLRSFVRWQPPHKPYYWGEHTKAMCAQLQRASDRLLVGKSTYIIVVVPPRHGKSDLASRRFGPWHLLREPTHEIILASYSANLATDMSHAARRCARDVGLQIDETRSQVGAWRTVQGGGMFAAGLGGTLTGRGADLLIIDDYLKGREEAESEIIRDKIWDSFRNDLMTRLAPVHAVVIPCTRWHEDDLVGRILEAQAKEPDFPAFQVVRFPAQGEDGRWLFPERFSPEYYRAQKAAVGSYAWGALYQGDPQPRHGNMFAIAPEHLLNGAEWPTELRCVRAWDLASSEKERAKDDPDYTVGLRAGLTVDKAGADHLWVEDIVRGQWEAPKRNSRMVQAAEGDTQGTPIEIEAVAGYKDCATEMRVLLHGRSVVAEARPGGTDKVARASALEPLFEAGHVHLRAAPWNQALIDELRAFPRGRHDDQVDALVIAYKALKRGQQVYIGGLD